VRVLAVYKSGITPIVSIILLLLMTVTASTAAYFWMINIQSNIQENVESNLEQSFAGELTSFTMVSSTCNATSENVSVVLLNTGSVDIDAGDLVLSLSSLAGSTLDTVIDTGFSGLDAATSTQLEYTSSYDIQADTTYAVKVTIPGGSSMSDSCTASS
jgi:flagellin-like protein